MKIHFSKTFSLIIVVALFSSCATIIGGSKYNATVIVPNHPEASISYNGTPMGTGATLVKIRRNQSNKVSFLIQENGCEDQTFSYSRRVLRGWALAATIVFWTEVSLIPIPHGVILDFSTGSIYKPDVRESGITKSSYNSFNYALNYKGCEGKRPVDNTIEEKLMVLKNLFLEGLISKEDYEKEKQKILKNQ